MMRTKTKNGIGVILGLVLTAWAGPTLAAADLQVNVTAKGTKADPVGPLNTTTATPIAAGRLLSVSCDNSSDCTKVKAVLQDGGTATPLSGTAANQSAATFALQPELVTSSSAQLQILYDTNKLNAFPVTAAKKATVTDTAGTAATDTKPVAELLGTACPQKAFDVQPYDWAGNSAEVVVTPRGSPITPLSSSFDENDELRVTVYGDARLMPLLKVSRKSGFRAVGGINILGMDVAVPSALQLHAEGLPTQTSCTTATFILRDFAPGKGEVEITVPSGNDSVAIGSFEFAVHPLYTGMFSLGGLWTPLLSPGFSVATRGSQTVVTQDEQGGRRFAYSFLYTPFVWASRDIEKGAEHWYHHLNPSVGFVLEHPLDNALLGATWDFNASVLVTAGVILSHVDHLQGVNVGDPFAGTTADLPVARQWDHGWFVAVSIDLRAAVALVRAVVSSPSTPATP